MGFNLVTNHLNVKKDHITLLNEFTQISNTLFFYGTSNFDFFETCKRLQVSLIDLVYRVLLHGILPKDCNTSEESVWWLVHTSEEVEPRDRPHSRRFTSPNKRGRGDSFFLQAVAASWDSPTANTPLAAWLALCSSKGSLAHKLKKGLCSRPRFLHAHYSKQALLRCPLHRRIFIGLVEAIETNRPALLVKYRLEMYGSQCSLSDDVMLAEEATEELIIMKLSNSKGNSPEIETDSDTPIVYSAIDTASRLKQVYNHQSIASNSDRDVSRIKEGPVSNYGSYEAESNISSSDLAFSPTNSNQLQYPRKSMANIGHLSSHRQNRGAAHLIHRRIKSDLTDLHMALNGPGSSPYSSSQDTGTNSAKALVSPPPGLLVNNSSTVSQWNAVPPQLPPRTRGESVATDISECRSTMSGGSESALRGNPTTRTQQEIPWSVASPPQLAVLGPLDFSATMERDLAHFELAEQVIQCVEEVSCWRQLSSLRLDYLPYLRSLEGGNSYLRHGEEEFEVFSDSEAPSGHRSAMSVQDLSYNPSLPDISHPRTPVDGEPSIPRTPVDGESSIAEPREDGDRSQDRRLSFASSAYSIYASSTALADNLVVHNNKELLQSLQQTTSSTLHPAVSTTTLSPIPCHTEPLTSISSAVAIARSFLCQLNLSDTEIHSLPQDLGLLVRGKNMDKSRMHVLSHSTSAHDMRWLVASSNSGMSPPAHSHLTASSSVFSLGLSGRHRNAAPFHSQSQKLSISDEWEPPKPEIITTCVTKSMRPQILKQQGNRCAGCGTYVVQAYVKRLRFCEYYGRFFCCICHKNTLMLVPGHVVQQWDLSMLPVSNFAHDLLDRITAQPIFCLDQLNPELVTHQRQVRDIEKLRTQTRHLLPFMQACRNAESQLALVRQLPLHWLTNYVYSMQDFESVRQGALPDILRRSVLQCTEHISTCPLCQARGFVCELCQLPPVIFPFQVDLTSMCPQCSATFHTICWQQRRSAKDQQESHCPRCRRLEKRKQDLCKSPLPGCLPDKTNPPLGEEGATMASLNCDKHWTGGGLSGTDQRQTVTTS